MALDINIRKRTLHFTEENKEIYVATANRGSVIDTKKIAKYIAEETGYKPAVVYGVLSNLTERMIEWMEEGHGVRFDGFGSFMPVVKSKSSENADEVGVKRVRVSFFPSRTLSQKVNAISINTEPMDDGTDDEDDTPSGGSTGNGGEDDGGGQDFS